MKDCEFLNADGEIALRWKRPRKVELLREGRRAFVPAEDGEVAFRCRVETHGFFDTRGETEPFRRSFVLVPGGPMEGVAIRWAEIPKLLKRIREMPSGEGVKERSAKLEEYIGGLVGEFGYLHEPRRDFRDMSGVVMAFDGVSAWTDLRDAAVLLFEILQDVGEGAPLRGASKIGASFVFKSGELEIWVPSAEATAGEIALEAAGRIIAAKAHLASFGLETTRLPSGRIVHQRRPKDLFSAIWSVLESSAADAGEPGLRLGRCVYCGEWDFVDGPPGGGERERSRVMRRRGADGAFYHQRCKTRERNREIAEEKRRENGLPYHKRPSARKKGVF